MTNDNNFSARIQERLSLLPQPVRDAITSMNVQQLLKTLASEKKLHVDQWEILENEVYLALLGFEPAENLENNLKKEVGVDDEMAHELVGAINEKIFEPIREELERELGHPQAKEEEKSAIENVRDAVLTEAKRDGSLAVSYTQSTPVAPVVAAPATTTTPETAHKEPASGAYRPGEASVARKDVVDDPYRETPQ